MRTSEKTDIIDPLFVLALSEVEDVAKSAFNEFGKFAFVPASAISSMVRRVLAAHGMGFMQEATAGPRITRDLGSGFGVAEIETVRCVTLVKHGDSGQWIESEFLPVAVEDRKGMSYAQCVGTTVSYCKKYGLSTMFGIVGDDDPDALGAGEQNLREQTAQARAEAVQKARRALAEKEAAKGGGKPTTTPPAGSQVPKAPQESLSPDF